MRILVLNHNLVGEGTWLRAWNLVRQLAPVHDVTFMAVSPKRRLFARCSHDQGYRAIETPFWGSRRLAASGLSFIDTAFRAAYVMSTPWDVLLTFSSLPSVGIPFLLAKRAFPHRRFVSDWDDLFSDGGVYEYLNRGLTHPLYRFERWLEYTIRRRADLVTVTSRYLEEKARAIGVTAPVLYLPTGADIERIRPMDCSACRQALDLPSDRCVIYFLGGGFNPDALLLLRAYALARKKNPALLLVMTGDLCAEYAQEMAVLNLGSDVVQTGRIPYATVPQYLGAADLLAMPLHDCVNSRARGPIKLRDYLCAGRPIVGTAIGEVKEVLSRYPVGLAVDSTPESFANGLLELSLDAGRREQMGQEARRVAEVELPWKAVGSSLLGALETLRPE